VETFIVRLWAPSPDLGDEHAGGELHGSVDHVRARESHRFETADGLLEILRLALDQPREEGATGASTRD
jgi:hypothetical protein